MGTPAKCLPVSFITIFPTCIHNQQCATALAATWDNSRIEEIGLKLLASEAKLKAASVILAPTCNIQRVSELRIMGLIVDQKSWSSSRIHLGAA